MLSIQGISYSWLYHGLLEKALSSKPTRPALLRDSTSSERRIHDHAGKVVQSCVTRIWLTRLWTWWLLEENPFLLVVHSSTLNLLLHDVLFATSYLMIFINFLPIKLILDIDSIFLMHAKQQVLIIYILN